LIFGTIILNLLSFALPLLLLQVYDRVIPNHTVSTLVLLVLGVGVALLLEAFLRFARSQIAAWGAARFEHLAGVRAFRHLLHADLASFEREGAGIHFERLNALEGVRDFYAGETLLTLGDLPFVVPFLGIVWYLAGPLVLVPVAAVSLFIVAAWRVGRRLRTALHDRAALDDRRYNFLLEVLGGANTVKALAMEALMLRRYERLLGTGAAATYRAALPSGLAQGLGSVFSQVVMVLAVGAGAWLVTQEQLTVGGLAACTLLVGRSIQPLQRAMGLWTRLQRARLARQRFLDVFGLPKTAPRSIPWREPVAAEVELQDVWFAYDRSGTQTIRGVSLRVAPGEAVSITGGNAVGKSTLLLLIAGLLCPRAGRVMIGGIDAHELDALNRTGGIALLPQQSVLFRGTLLDNLTSFQTEERADSALRMTALLGVDEVIGRLPQGYQTEVTDQAIQSLPLGVLQRITIARALASKPTLLLFDEANSCLDRHSDAVLKDVLASLRCRTTMVLVGHRPSVIGLAKRQYLLADGVLRPRSAPIPTQHAVA
jgi:ATP-binding cassette subfamily C protein LapB